MGDFGDLRLAKTGSLLLERMVNKMTVCLRKLGSDRALEVAFGRLLRNPKFSMVELKNQAIQKTNKLSSSLDHVLAIQDTTEINFELAEYGQRKDLGRLTNKYFSGFFLHPSIVIDADSMACLGLGSFQYWVRPQEERKWTRSERQHTPIEEKESFSWIKTALEVGQNISTKQITHVCDREADIYELFCRVPDNKNNLLIRSRSNRVLTSKGRLQAYLEGLPAAGTIDIEIPSIPGKRKARGAHLEVRYSPVEINKPKNVSATNLPPSISLFAIDVKEVAQSKEKVHWRLLTTHAVTTMEEALQVVNWYKQRWHIEQFFRTLKKQGLNVEASQLESRDSLLKMTVLASIAAVKCLQLVQARDGNNKRKSSDVFEPQDYNLLKNIQKQYERKTNKQKNPHSTGSLAWAAWIIARMGGWNGYRSERPPGPITMRNGLEDFYRIKQGWLLAKNMCIP